MHTPEQANNLWCPMARVALVPKAGGPAAINDPTTLTPARCVADQCTMWRWERTTESVQSETQGARTFKQRVVQTHGYCGLAGTPWSAAA